MTQTEIFNKIRELAVANNLVESNDAPELTEKTSLSNYLDSMDKMELLVLIDREFNAFITDEEAERIRTFGNLAALVEKKLHF